MAVLWMLMAAVSGCAGGRSGPDAVGELAIYLVRPGLAAQQVLEMRLAELELEKEPILSGEDIVTYTWDTHEMELTTPARERVAALQVPATTGVPFVVCVGDERIYSGAFWVSWSSMSFPGIVIDTTLATMDGHSLRIQLGYPGSPEFFEGEDLRSDPTILQSLTASGKLR
jgi:hypothetical protein